MYNKYGPEHRQAKYDHSLSQGQRSELTGRLPTPENRVHAHHMHKISLAFLVHSHYKENMMNLLADEHHDFHQKTNSTHNQGKTVMQRQDTARRLWNEPEDQKLREQLAMYDNILIPEYVQKILENFPPAEHEVYVQKMLVGAYGHNRELMIDLHIAQKRIEKLEKTIESLKKHHQKKVVDISAYRHRDEL